MQETRVPSLGQVDLLENGMATHPSVLAWRSSWGTWQEHGRLQSMESQRFRHDWMANTTLYVWISQLCPIFKETIRLNVCTRYYGYLGWLIFTWGPEDSSERPEFLSHRLIGQFGSLHQGDDREQRSFGSCLMLPLQQNLMKGCKV